MGRTRREDHELAPLSRLVVNLPMKLGASVGHVVAIKNPGQQAMDRLGGFVANCPIAVPALETLTRGVALQVEDWIHKQLLLRAALAKEGALLQVALQPSCHAAQDHLRQGEGLGIGAVDGHQADVGGNFGGLSFAARAKGHPGPPQVNAALIKGHHPIGEGLEAGIAIGSKQIHQESSCQGRARAASNCCQRCGSAATLASRPSRSRAASTLP